MSKAFLYTLPLLLVACVCQGAVPALTGPVVDEARVIDAASHAELTKLLQRTPDEECPQIGILTVNTLGGRSIETYTQEVADAWKLGRKGVDNGVLIVVAVKDHKMRIATGRGAEGRLTDVACKHIIERQMKPAFRANRFGAGLLDAVHEIDRLSAHREAAAPVVVPAAAGGGLSLLWILLIPALPIVLVVRALTKARPTSSVPQPPTEPKVSRTETYQRQIDRTPIVVAPVVARPTPRPTSSPAPRKADPPKRRETESSSYESSGGFFGSSGSSGGGFDFGGGGGIFDGGGASGDW